MSFVVTHPETSASAARNPQAIGSTAAAHHMAASAAVAAPAADAGSYATTEAANATSAR
ncbi:MULTISPECIES: hypothetical protein [unclassified Mycobacterium]|uniref:hypothetical protein n=1 Tax=unclassified Mycobacterium TaxID=2642494 RepID=UPI002741155D|nr:MULTISPECIES: hypothetical protein [unclassified Mycobacterium]MDP7705900.1 hypothetical protein [Mycobacterium sp. TY815]MDP7725374.1 hypothetical protein [Mycobacterium sp. TY814]